jgi:hypothetical protein
MNLTGGWPIGLFSGRWVNEAGFIFQSHTYYGGTESNVFSAMKMSNYELIMLEDREDLMTTVNFDEEYILWKKQVIQEPNGPDFAEWLRIKQLLDTKSTDTQ